MGITRFDTNHVKTINIDFRKDGGDPDFFGSLKMTNIKDPDRVYVFCKHLISYFYLNRGVPRTINHLNSKETGIETRIVVR